MIEIRKIDTMRYERLILQVYLNSISDDAAFCKNDAKQDEGNAYGAQ